MAAKFREGDRVRINPDLFPTFDRMLFSTLPGTGRVLKVEPDSILPYQCLMDRFEHHPFWFYENQLSFADPEQEKAWQAANAPKPRAPAGKAAAPAHGEGH